MPRGEGAGSFPTYRIFETKQFLSDIGRQGQPRLEAKLQTYIYPILLDNPRFGPNIKQLKNWDPPTWRYRVGDWRFFYEIDEEKRIVFMLACKQRK